MTATHKHFNTQHIMLGIHHHFNTGDYKTQQSKAQIQLTTYNLCIETKRESEREIEREIERKREREKERQREREKEKGDGRYLKPRNNSFPSNCVSFSPKNTEPE
ncbi:unnamed protein product [Boreogadus saida]